MEVKITRKVHQLYKKMPEGTQYFGKWQYFLYADSKTLSIIELKADKFLRSKDHWEVADISNQKALKILGDFDSFEGAKDYCIEWFRKVKINCLKCGKALLRLEKKKKCGSLEYSVIDFFCNDDCREKFYENLNLAVGYSDGFDAAFDICIREMELNLCEQSEN